MKSLLIFTLLFASTLSVSALAGTEGLAKNLCDDLIDNGGSKADIKTCLKAFKKSEYRLAIEKAAKEKGEIIAANEEEEAKLKKEEEKERKKYIIRKFEGKEVMFLNAANFVARKYTDQELGPDETVDSKMTSPKEMCEYLGFEDATSGTEGVGYTLSKRIQDYNNADYRGIYVNWNGKKKEVNWDDNEPSAVKHYTSIVCKRKRKSGENPQSFEMQAAIRLLNDVNSGISSDNNDGSHIEINREDSKKTYKRPRENVNYDKFTHDSNSVKGK